MKEVKEILKNALFKLDKEQLKKDFTLFDSHIKNGSTYKLHIDNESYDFFISQIDSLENYKIFANWMNGLSGFCNMALLSKDKTHEIKLDKVCYRIIIE